MGETIRFEQVVFTQDNKEKGEVYKERLLSMIRVFSKDTFLQFVESELWFDMIELASPYQEKDYSKFLFQQTEKIFQRFEDMQSDDTLEKSREILIECVKRANNRKKKDENNGEREEI